MIRRWKHLFQFHRPWKYTKFAEIETVIIRSYPPLENTGNSNLMVKPLENFTRSGSNNAWIEICFVFAAKEKTRD